VRLSRKRRQISIFLYTKNANIVRLGKTRHQWETT
jgi:hypothetical protein